ncbi:hypothetical protein RUMCAL_00399 [Ruminococcus callidus ATCC 27760]|jgi:hypothetical protein|uniref:Uncharacterized protein n=1 Tax=Ruminococcus callidus ATCC 27760 TaxID=411473 RepID=U2KYF3_9FIRM|nr:hypothetical protein [Ruminococcus callidus]ERJ97327.1 hypothetical protein RUMCAL_00399 [Ruminococcus callidus ATCC 27760]
MKPIVKIVYDREKDTLKISYDDKTLDTKCIRDFPIEQWLFPLSSKGVKWKGLYEELRSFTGKPDYTLLFESDAASFEMVKYALKDSPVNLISSNNTVTILYSENPFVTKITINGHAFDTTRIQNRSIDEWINSIQIRDLQWKGIFQELTDYIGTDIYEVYFIGNLEFMQLLIDSCPNSVDVLYRDTEIAKMQNKSNHIQVASNPVSKPAESNSNQYVVSGSEASQSISHIASKAVNTLKSAAAAQPHDENFENIPIKNKFVRNHIMTICSIITLVFTFFPFASFYAKSAEDTGNRITASVFSTLVGIKELKLGDNKSIFSILIFLVPILIIIMNYIKPLGKYKKYIAVGAPIIGIIGEVVTFIDLKHLFQTFIIEDGVKLKSILGIGFFLILASFCLTAIVGLIIYHNVKLPKTKN